MEIKSFSQLAQTLDPQGIALAAETAVSSVVHTVEDGVCPRQGARARRAIRTVDDYERVLRRATVRYQADPVRARQATSFFRWLVNERAGL